MSRAAETPPDDPQRIVDAYLRELSGSVLTTTHESHKQDIKSFISWHDGEEDLQQDMEGSVARYLEGQLQSSHNTATVYGRTCTLTNLLAYKNRTDPELTTFRLLKNSRLEQTPDGSQLVSEIAAPVQNNTSPTGHTETEIEVFLSYLRRSQYGTRVHAYAEIILSTRGRPVVVRLMDLSDVELQKKRATVGLTDTHIVGSAGIVQDRVATLDEQAIDALEEYITNHRKSTDSDSLFTTTHGRVSPSTSRRSFSRVSEKASKLLNSDNLFTEAGDSTQKTPDGSPPTVYPSDIWWYAVRQIIK